MPTPSMCGAEKPDCCGVHAPLTLSLRRVIASTLMTDQKLPPAMRNAVISDTTKVISCKQVAAYGKVHAVIDQYEMSDFFEIRCRASLTSCNSEAALNAATQFIIEARTRSIQDTPA